MTLTASRATTPEWLHLPRAASLTDALLAPALSPPAEIQEGVLERLRRDLDRAASPIDTGVSAPGRGVRIGAFQLAEAIDNQGTRVEDAFRWSARNARRSLGLAAVAACADGTVPSPSAGVARAMAILRGRGVPHPAISHSLAEWVASLPVAARAIVAADATTWATRLWTSVEWDRLAAGTSVGGPDEWWHHPVGGVRVALRGRADVRTTTSDGAGALLTVCGGWPSAAGRAALVLAALVPALRRPGVAAPARVVGWWPDCGRAWIVPVDAGTLSMAAGGVAMAAGRELRRAESGASR